MAIAWFSLVYRLLRKFFKLKILTLTLQFRTFMESIIELCRTLKIGNKNCSLQPLIGCSFGSVFRVETGSGGPYLTRFSPSLEGLASNFVLCPVGKFVIMSF